MAEAIVLATFAFIGVEATAVAVLAGTAIVGAGISVATSLLAAQFLSQDRPAKPPSDRQFISNAPIQPRVRSYGRVRVAGAQCFMAAKNGSLYRVLAHNDGEIDAVEEHVIDETVVTLDGSGFVTSPSRLASSRVRIIWHEGDAGGLHYTALETAFPEWSSDHLGKGVAHSLTVFRQVGQSKFFDVYPQGENTVYKQTLRGAKVWDPRELSQDPDDASTWTWSDNSALILLDHLRHPSGLGMPMAWIEPEIEAWQAAADACDESVPLAAGGTVSRYKTWGTYSYDERPGDVHGRLSAACNARVWIGPNGGLTVSVGVWQAPTVTIGADAILSLRISSGTEGPDAVNTVTAVYVEADQAYREIEAEPWADDDLVIAFGEQRANAELYYVPNHSQCRRLMKQALGRLAPTWSGTVTTNLLGLQVLSERFITLELEDIGETITAEINNIEFVIDNGNVVTGAIIDFVSVAASLFDWNAATEEGTPSGTPPTISDTAFSAPGNFAVLIEPRSNAAYAVAVASWDAPAVEGLVTRLEYRVDGATDWLVVTSSEDAVSVETPPLTDGQTYNFRAQHVGLLTTSDYTSPVDRDVIVDNTAPGVPTGLSTSLATDDVTIAWRTPNSPNTFGSRVYRHTADDSAAATLIATVYGNANTDETHVDEDLAADDYWWWISTINGSGVESARTAAGSETVT